MRFLTGSKGMVQSIKGWMNWITRQIQSRFLNREKKFDDESIGKSAERVSSSKPITIDDTMLG